VRRLLPLVLLALLAPGAAWGQRTDPTDPKPATVTTFAVTGHGWGHGVGMAQWGAYGYAENGTAYDGILAHYYPGTELTQAPPAPLRILLTTGKTVTMASAADFQVQDALGQTHPLAAGSYALDATLALPDVGPLQAPLVFRPGKAPLQLGAPYRGSIEIDVSGKKLLAVNVVGLDAYIRGVIPREMPKDWPLEALKAQAVAARSYALAARRGGVFDLYADTRDQVYGGLGAETPTTNEAVTETKGQVLDWGGKVATTYFFSSSGGRTAAIADVFPDKPRVPYLVSVRDPYDVMSPWHDWGPVLLTGGQMSKKLGIAGVSDVLAAPDTGRARTVTVTAAAGVKTLPAASIRWALNLRSTWFRVAVLSLTRPAGPVLPGSDVILSGIVRRISIVLLEQKPQYGDWESGPAIEVAPDGTFSVGVRPNGTTLYRLVGDGVDSAPLRVPVAGAS
jgi:stage II sporulation protein D